MTTSKTFKIVQSWNKYSFFAIALTAFHLTACVSVKIESPPSRKALGIEFVAPPSPPFEKLKIDQVDQAWQSEKTGNTLVVISECQSNTDITLRNIESETLQALSDYQIDASSEIQFNEREALSTQAHGKVDGVEMKMHVLTFKKNSCNYTISFLGKKDSFSKEDKHFEAFLNSFRAP